MLQDVGDIVSRDPGIGGDQDRAGERRCVMGSQHDMGVAGQHCDTVARGDAQRFQCTGEPQAALEKFGIGELLLAIRDADPVAVDHRSPAQERSGRQRLEIE